MEHDNIVAVIEKELITRGYHNNYHYVKYDKGEIDLYNIVSEINDKYVLLFEVKSHYSPRGERKAKDQLSRAEQHYFSENKRVFKFFAYSDYNDNVICNWVKH